jgi:uncharacterized protein involved in exopolysaccharide biosynthesis
MEQEPDLQGDEAESEPEGSVSPVELLYFIIRSAKRHARLGLAVGATIATIGVSVGIILPSRYETESRILQVQSAAVTAALSSPESRMPTVDAFGGSSEILMQKSNLRWLVQQAKLVNHWKATRTTLFRWKDSLIAALAGPLSDNDIANVLVDILKTRMYVTSDTSILTIHVAWQDPDAALNLTRMAQERFFELRRTQELGAINAAIDLNEEEVKRAAEAIDQSLEEVMQIRDKRKQEALSAPEPSTATSKPEPSVTSKRRRIAVATPKTATSESPSPTPPDRKMAARLAEVRQRAHDIEVPWQQRLAELKFQLADMRGTFGPEHPVVRQQEAKIREATEPPAELAALHGTERQLLAEIETEQQTAAGQSSVAGNTVRYVTDDKPSQAPSSANRVQALGGTVVITEREEDPMLAPAKARLQSAIATYNDVSKRLQNARSQLATSQVALTHRYVVVTEPERPRKPTKPNRPILIFGALLVGSLLGFLIGAIRDFISGLVFEPWQVRTIGLPVLGEVEINRNSKK